MGDKVVLMPYSGGQPLHVSELELPDHPGSKEVCQKEISSKYSREKNSKQKKIKKAHSLLVLQYHKSSHGIFHAECDLQCIDSLHVIDLI